MQGTSGSTREGAWAGCDRARSGRAHVQVVDVQGGCERPAGHERLSEGCAGVRGVKKGPCRAGGRGPSVCEQGGNAHAGMSVSRAAVLVPGETVREAGVLTQRVKMSRVRVPVQERV